MPATDKIQALKDAHAAMKATRKAAKEAYDALTVAYQAAYVEDEDTAYETLNALTDADLDELEAEILSLLAADRARLLERLIASFDPLSDQQQTGLEQAAQRQAEVKAGSVSMVSGDEPLARVRARLG
jgi:bisphosphoglycerate-independent phosphoglycerate mutase (AlkP superfamily)